MNFPAWSLPVVDRDHLHRLCRLVQEDMKKLVAYSSIAHMGFVTLGFFMFSALGVEGALVQMISHGFVSGAMFFAIGVMYDRAHSRQIADYGGVVNTMPKFAAFFMLFAMANAGLPATSGFVGEFMVILAAVDYNFWVAFAAASTMIVGAAIHPVDVQARGVWRGGQSPRGRTDRHQRPRVPRFRPLRHRRAGHGSLSPTVY
jgi:NADH:ubiquinone oxidoreductase subunit 4 (subunit M)